MGREGVIATYSEQRHAETCMPCLGLGYVWVTAFDLMRGLYPRSIIKDRHWDMQLDRWRCPCPNCDGTGKPA